MQPKTPLEQQLISILAANRANGYGTQRKRSGELAQAARALHNHFRLQKWANLGAKHVAYVVEGWKAKYAGKRTLDQKLTHFRWLVRKIGKANLIPRENRELGIEPGPRYTRAGRFITQE